MILHDVRDPVFFGLEGIEFPSYSAIDEVVLCIYRVLMAEREGSICLTKCLEEIELAVRARLRPIYGNKISARKIRAVFDLLVKRDCIIVGRSKRGGVRAKRSKHIALGEVRAETRNELEYNGLSKKGAVGMCPQVRSDYDLFSAMVGARK